MPDTTDKIVVLITCGSAKEARRIARALIDRRAAACVNIFKHPVESIYRWKGEIETAKEYLLIIKTSRKQFERLQKIVRSLHSYDVPEIIALPLVTGSRDYIAWVSESLGAPKK